MSPGAPNSPDRSCQEPVSTIRRHEQFANEPSLFLMLFIRSLASVRYILLAISISLNSEIMSPCSYYAKRGLVYIIIINPSNCQPSFCLKCTKANTYLLYNVYSVSINKCISGFSYNACRLSQL